MNAIIYKSREVSFSIRAIPVAINTDVNEFTLSTNRALDENTNIALNALLLASFLYFQLKCGILITRTYPDARDTFQAENFAKDHLNLNEQIVSLNYSLNVSVFRSRGKFVLRFKREIAASVITY